MQKQFNNAKKKYNLKTQVTDPYIFKKEMESNACIYNTPTFKKKDVAIVQ